MLFQLLLITLSLCRHCVPITNTTICNPWNTQQIDLTALKRIYEIPAEEEFTVKKWEDLVTEITKKESQELMFNKYLRCTGYEENMVQYHTTYVCTVDLFVHSKKCNPNPEPLCRNECDKFEQSVSDFVQDESICPFYRSRKMREISQRRKEVLYGVEHCNSLFSSGVFGTKSCIAGVDIDRNSCGFGGDLKLAKEYCKEQKAPCCSYIEQKPGKVAPKLVKNETTFESHWYDSMKRLVTYWSATDDIKENNAHVRKTAGIAASILFVIFVLGIIGYIVHGKLQEKLELERNRRALYEETRSFNSKYTPVLGEE